MQTIFSDIEYGNRKKKTRKETFFNQMEEIVPWNEIYEIIKPYYDTEANKHGERKRVPLETMTKMYLVSNWFTLSDPATEDEITTTVMQ
jgi:IS5 family transposase